jgi:hypothetical protein
MIASDSLLALLLYNLLAFCRLDYAGIRRLREKKDACPFYLGGCGDAVMLCHDFCGFLLYISHIDLFYKDTNNVEKVSVVV